MDLEHMGHTRFFYPTGMLQERSCKSSKRSHSKRATSALPRRETWSNSCFASSARHPASGAMAAKLVCAETPLARFNSCVRFVRHRSASAYFHA